MSNRLITDHKLNGLNDRIKITAVDEPGSGGANHRYMLELSESENIIPRATCIISFQKGPIQSVEDMNGMTNEALLAVIIDRMRGFQGMNRTDGTAGTETNRMPAPYACAENALALRKLQEAMHWLQHRTRERLARGVEGTLKP